MDDLQEYDFNCFPDLQTSLKLDGLTLEELLKRFSAQQCDYAFKVKQGWLEQFSYAGLILTVLVHSKQKGFVWGKITNWVFHPNVEEINEPDFEIWLKQKAD